MIIVEKEKVDVPAKELDKYFFSTSTDQAYFPMAKHLQMVHEQLDAAFPTDPATLVHFQKALLKVAKSTNISIVPKVKETCWKLAMRLETLAFNQKMYEECKALGE